MEMHIDPLQKAASNKMNSRFYLLSNPPPGNTLVATYGNNDDPAAFGF